MSRSRQIISWSAALLTAAALSSSLSAEAKKEAKRPALSLKASPGTGMVPIRVSATAEFKGGANDFQEYYCPTVLWDWADGTESESTVDCEPYEPGKSEIKRRYTVQHTFRAGAHKVWIRLKRNDKLLASANVTVQVQPGRGVDDDR